MISESPGIFWNSSRIFLSLPTPSSGTEDASPWRSSRCRASVISWRVMWPLQQLLCRDLVNWRIWSARTWLLVPEQLADEGHLKITWRSPGANAGPAMLTCKMRPLLGWSTRIYQIQKLRRAKNHLRASYESKTEKMVILPVQRKKRAFPETIWTLKEVVGIYRSRTQLHWTISWFSCQVWHRASEHETKTWWCLPNLCVSWQHSLTGQTTATWVSNRGPACLERSSCWWGTPGRTWRAACVSKLGTPPTVNISLWQ